MQQFHYLLDFVCILMFELQFHNILKTQMSVYGTPLGVHVATSSTTTSDFKRTTHLIRFWAAFGAGRRQGWGPSESSDSAELKLPSLFNTSCSPFGDAANLKASPLPRAPSG